MVPITGNTFPVKDALKALGGKWDASQKTWMVPAAKADEARRLVAGSGKTRACDSVSSYQPKTCRVCGQAPRRDARGFSTEGRILRSGECQDCYAERKMGY